MLIPLCSGMERSGSTLTWQVVSCLVPKSRPLNWSPGCEVKDWTGHPTDWPIKRHDYMGGDLPVIYSYRHPVEAFLSLRRCFLTDVGSDIVCDKQYATDHAGRLILESRSVYEEYERDRASGRPVLFLRYEDYYDEPAKRIDAIAMFMLIVPKLRNSERNQILDYTDIKKNAARANGRSFHNSRHYTTSIQGQHIDTENWGEPGKLLKKYRPFVELVRNDPKMKELKEFCELLGYDL